MFCILVLYIINVFIFLFIYFHTGPILIAVFITEMVILFKHVIIIIIYATFAVAKRKPKKKLIGRALHRYRRGQGFESRTSLDFFQAFLSQLQKLRL